MKLVDTDAFSLYLFSLIPTRYAIIEILSYLLIAFEFGLGICFAIGCGGHYISWTGLFVLLFLSVFLLWRIVIGDTGNCHCFGEKLSMPPSVSLIKNLVLLVLIIIGWNNNRSKIRWPYYIVGFCVILLGICLFSPPNLLSSKRDSSDINEEQLYELINEKKPGDGTHLYVFMSPSCAYCQKFINKLNSLVEHDKIGLDAIWIFFMDTDLTTNDIDLFFEKYSAGRRFNYSLLQVEKFLGITEGNMPSAALISSGVFIREINLITLNENSVNYPNNDLQK